MRRALLLLTALLVMALPATAAASDGVVTYSSNGTSKLTDDAQRWLDEYGKVAHDRFKEGGSKLYPPESWTTNPAVKDVAKADAKRWAATMGKVAGKGAVRVIPWVGVGLTAYTICGIIDERCKVFGRDGGNPASTDAGWVLDPTAQPTTGLCYGEPSCTVPEGWVFFYRQGSINGTNTYTMNDCGTTGLGVPTLGILYVTTPTAGGSNPACDNGEVGNVLPATTFMAGVTAGADTVTDAASAAQDAGTTYRTHLFDEDDLDELATELDKPENRRTRQHIASEIEEDVPDPYSDGVMVPKPTSTETYAQYAERLQAAGLLGQLRFANEYHPAPAGTLAGRVFEVSPEGGTKLTVGATVTYRAVPMDGTGVEPGTDPGTGGGTAPETGIATPPVGDAPAQCAPAWASPDLTPLAVSLTDKWPFGFPVWIGRILSDLSVTGAAPNVSMPEIGGQSWTLDLADWDSVASVTRTVTGWAGSIFIIAWITGLALNRRITRED